MGDEISFRPCSDPCPACGGPSVDTVKHFYNNGYLLRSDVIRCDCQRDCVAAGIVSVEEFNAAMERHLSGGKN